MDIEKLKIDFEKRFERECQRTFFVGMPLTIISGQQLQITASLSVGGCILSADRDDGRIVIEYKDNTTYISCNILEFNLHQNIEQIAFLEKLKNCGIKLSGADLLIDFNSDLYNDNEILLTLALAKGITPKDAYAVKKDMVGIIGKRSRLLFSNKENFAYLPFCDRYCIVLCSIDERQKGQPTFKDAVIARAKTELMKENYENFGELVTSCYCSKKYGTKTQKMLSLATMLDDGIGYGVLNNGGIFAIVKTDRADTFIYNLKKAYENTVGSAPKFYVTLTANSGFFGK